jgi:hypothetical protein
LTASARARLSARLPATVPSFEVWPVIAKRSSGQLWPNPTRRFKVAREIGRVKSNSDEPTRKSMSEKSRLPPLLRELGQPRDLGADAVEEALHQGLALGQPRLDLGQGGVGLAGGGREAIGAGADRALGVGPPGLGQGGLGLGPGLGEGGLGLVAGRPDQAEPTVHVGDQRGQVGVLGPLGHRQGAGALAHDGLTRPQGRQSLGHLVGDPGPGRLGRVRGVTLDVVAGPGGERGDEGEGEGGGGGHGRHGRGLHQIYGAIARRRPPLSAASAASAAGQDGRSDRPRTSTGRPVDPKSGRGARRRRRVHGLLRPGACPATAESPSRSVRIDRTASTASRGARAPRAIG